MGLLTRALRQRFAYFYGKVTGWASQGEGKGYLEEGGGLFASLQPVSKLLLKIYKGAEDGWKFLQLGDREGT